jgi:c-di-GMP-binding flagellar brake protein YcgR
MRSYRCEVLEQLSQTQRREDLKISLSAKVEVSYNGGHWPATIYNISASGVLLVSDLVAKSGEQLTFDFPKISPPISLVAEVLRVELRPARYGRVTYGYGCRFLNLTPQQESQLRSYIFQEERRLYHPD